MQCMQSAATAVAMVWCVSFLLVQLSVWMVLTGAHQRHTRESEGAVVGESVFRNLQSGAGGNLSPQSLGFGSNQDPSLGNFGGFSRDQLLSQLFRSQQQGNQFGSQQPSSQQFALQNNPRVRFPPPQSQEQFFQQPIFPTKFSQQNQFVSSRNQNNLLPSANDASRENLLRQFNLFSSSVVSTPLPNISPSQAFQSANRIKNPLLQTLFKSTNFQQQPQESPRSSKKFGNPFSQIGLQQTPREETRNSLVQQARERELIERQRQLNLLLDENNEKEKLLIDALKERGNAPTTPIVPTFIPATTPTTISTTTTTTTTTSTTTVATDFEEDFGNADSTDLENEEFEVEIILQMTRELVEARQKELLQESEKSSEASKDGTPITELQEEKVEATSPRPNTPFEAIMNAREAVIKTMKEGNERTSPAVWAAVKILADFVDSQDPGLPSDVLQAIIQLTEFLNTEMSSPDTSDKIVSPTTSRTTSTTTPAPSPSTSGLSATQLRLREEILKQKLLKQKQINKILESSSQNKEEKRKPSIKIPPSSKTFPSRINLMNVKLRGNQFSFSTLPIY